MKYFYLLLAVGIVFILAFGFLMVHSSAVSKSLSDEVLYQGIQQPTLKEIDLQMSLINGRDNLYCSEVNYG